jgi:hypothetical protein
MQAPEPEPSSSSPRIEQPKPESDAPPRQRAGSEGTNARLLRVQYYPMVLVACYLFATVNRIYEAAGGTSFALTLLHTIGASSQGTLNAAVYGLTPQVRQALVALGAGVLERARQRLGPESAPPQ